MEQTSAKKLFGMTNPIPLSRKINSDQEEADQLDSGVELLESGRFTLVSSEWSESRAKKLSDPTDNFPASKYEVLGAIGYGGMGVVYEAVHRLTQRRVALKTLRPEFIESGEAVQRFLTEARILARVSGPGVVQLYDCAMGELGAPYMTMERLVGIDLRQWLDKRGQKPCTADVALRVAYEVAGALSGVHDRDVVHRDLKPENIFLARGNRGRTCTKLVDFGVAKASSNRCLTSSERALGSLMYMAPEQLNDSSQASPGSDVWSIGIVLLELLLGRHPYPHGASESELICRILGNEPPSLEGATLPVDPRVAALVEGCLAKDPARRYPDARSLAKAIRQVMAELEGTES